MDGGDPRAYRAAQRRSREAWLAATRYPRLSRLVLDLQDQERPALALPYYQPDRPVGAGLRREPAPAGGERIPRVARLCCTPARRPALCVAGPACRPLGGNVGETRPRRSAGKLGRRRVDAEIVGGSMVVTRQ
jgi:hypothetical protein